METRRLGYFMRIAEDGSLTKAALEVRCWRCWGQVSRFPGHSQAFAFLEIMLRTYPDMSPSPLACNVQSDRPEPLQGLYLHASRDGIRGAF
jgi:hypothetical protein